MEQVTAVGKGTTFFLLLLLAASASATSLNAKQKNTAITATSGRQVRSVCVCVCLCVCVCQFDPVILDASNLCGLLTLHTIPPHSLFLQKKAIPSFPLKVCTSSNAGEIWTAQGGAQADSIWVCQNNKWIPYE